MKGGNMLKELWKALGLVKDFNDSKICYGKRWFTSKTLWTNALALIALILQSHWGFVLDPEVQAAILIIINFILRFTTTQPVVAKESSIIVSIDGSPVIKAKTAKDMVNELSGQEEQSELKESPTKTPDIG